MSVAMHFLILNVDSQRMTRVTDHRNNVTDSFGKNCKAQMRHEKDNGGATSLIGNSNNVATSQVGVTDQLKVAIKQKPVKSQSKICGTFQVKTSIF